LIVTARAAQEFAAGPDGMAAADAFLSDFGTANGIEERVVFRARVCVAELTANALEHGRAHPDADKFTISVAWDEGSTLDLEFADTSNPFDPTRPVRAPDPESAGGRGLLLVQGLATRSHYRRDGGSNRVHLQFSAA
jgi:anti-sigma regulatory factor (Ser/Thr protein kinase)